MELLNGIRWLVEAVKNDAVPPELEEQCPIILASYRRALGLPSRKEGGEES